jgi:hypothetical protein
VDQDDEGRRAAVEDRHLGAVHLDERVVHPQRVERGEQVLDGVHAHALAREARGMVEASEVLEGGRDLDAHVRPAEADAVAGGGGPEVEPHRLAGMQPDAGTADGPLERPAIAHENAAAGPAIAVPRTGSG